MTAKCAAAGGSGVRRPRSRPDAPPQLATAAGASGSHGLMRRSRHAGDGSAQQRSSTVLLAAARSLVGDLQLRCGGSEARCSRRQLAAQTVLIPRATCQRQRCTAAQLTAVCGPADGSVRHWNDARKQRRSPAGGFLLSATYGHAVLPAGKLLSSVRGVPADCGKHGPCQIRFAFLLGCALGYLPVWWCGAFCQHDCICCCFFTVLKLSASQ